MWLDLTDEETLALLHLLTETAFTRIRILRGVQPSPAGPDMDGARRG
jgi:hypothetical protein